jgi:hypothetical protein
VFELLVIVLLDGREAHINPRHIVSITEARDADDPGKHYTDKVRCALSLSDGKLFTTEEECDSIDARLHEIAAKRIREMRK